MSQLNLTIDQYIISWIKTVNFMKCLLQKVRSIMYSESNKKLAKAYASDNRLDINKDKDLKRLVAYYDTLD